MKSNLTTVFLSFLFVAMLIFQSSCLNDGPAEGIDKQLYDMAVLNQEFTWYKNSDVMLSKSSGSGHSESKLRTRYNKIAATVLDSNGKILSEAKFPEGSLIVKELADKNDKIKRYAILHKDSLSLNADSKGWVWGYIFADGDVSESSDLKGKKCISCHSQNGNIDYMLMNKFYP